MRVYRLVYQGGEPWQLSCDSLVIRGFLMDGALVGAVS
jgi:hypothetical protein